MSVKVTFSDKGLKKLQKTLRGLGDYSVEVGFLDEAGRRIHPGSVLPVATIAAIVEFGEDDTPARAFMRSAITLRRTEITKVVEREMALIVNGKKSEVEGLSVIGAFTAKVIRDRISNAASWAAPLDAETVEEKGSARPLEDTGVLKASVGWRVMKAGQRVARGQ